jgi:hypothetical protein
MKALPSFQTSVTTDQSVRRNVTENISYKSSCCLGVIDVTSQSHQLKCTKNNFLHSLLLFIPCIINYLQILTVATNAQLYVHLCILLLISSYMFRLNCHHHVSNPYTINTYKKNSLTGFTYIKYTDY